MGGIAFAAKGASAGPAARAFWFSPLADKFTCLMPWSETGQPDYQTLPVPMRSCNFTNQFNIVRASYGQFATAPDGTTNVAQKIVEDTSNNTHYTHAELRGWGGSFPTLRFAGIYAAGERSRFAWQVKDGGTGNTTTVGFDLAGGQVAYGPTAGVSILGANTPSIVKLGTFGGKVWWLCLWDVAFGVVSNHIPLYTLLDNGTGTNAQSTSYTGDGSSGIFGWRHSLFPKRAWAMGTQTFFQDFTDTNIANYIDVNNTKAPGFQFYTDALWPGPLGVQDTGWLDQNNGNKETVLPASHLSASASALRIAALNPTAIDNTAVSYELTTATHNGPGTYVGNVWRMPCLLECSFKYPMAIMATNDSQFSNLIWWSGTVEPVAQMSVPISASNPAQRVARNDGSGWIHLNTSLWESASATFPRFGYNGGTCTIGHQGLNSNYNEVRIGGVNSNPPGQFLTPVYIPGIDHSAGQPPVVQGGIFYVSVGDPGVNNPPPNAPWTTPYNYGTGPGQFETVPQALDIANTFNLQQWFFIPYDPVTKDPGCHMLFQNYWFNSGHTWRPSGFDSGATGQDAADPYMHRIDWQSQFMMWRAGIVNGSGYDLFIDYFRVTQ